MSAVHVERPAVLRGLALDRHTVVEASAGTGKTFTLEHLIVELLVSTEVTLDRVLVVSFTEKATAEIRARVRAKLRELLSSDGAPAAESPIPSQDSFSLDAVARQKLELALRAFDSTTIVTIHAFCQRVLRESAFASGRLFEEEQVDGRDAFGRAFRDTLRREIARDRARADWLGAALSTGWSLERVESLLWLAFQSRGELRPGLNPNELGEALARFPVDQARRSENIAELQRWGAHPRTAQTLARRLKDIGDEVERAREEGSGTPGFVILAEKIDFSYVFEKLAALVPRPGPTADLCAAALRLVRATPSLSGALVQTILPALRGELARRKRSAGQYDFDDMLGLVDEALHGSRGLALATAMRQRWRYVLIDECQDTDETQWSIFRRAFFDPALGRPSVLCLVGDPKQSIYRFRGADVHTYLGARDEIVSSGGQLVTLDRNYRATPALVTMTNALFDPSAPTPIFAGSLAYSPVQSGRPDRTLLDADGRAATPVHVLRLGKGIDSRAIASLGEQIAREVRALTDPARPWRFDGQALGHGDIFVLTRNAREGRIVAAALRAAGVSHAFYKQDGLFQTNEAQEIRTLLLAIDRPDDRSRRLAAWLTPFFGLPLSAIQRARDLPVSHPLFARLYAWKALAQNRDFDRLFEAILTESGVVRRLIFFADDERELTNYLHIFELLHEHTHRSHATLHELVGTLSGLIEQKRMPLDLEGNVQRLESERRAVQIMTIHKSKGLEAPIVFVVGGFSPPPNDDVRVYHEGGRRLAWVGRIDQPGVEARVKAEEREEDQRLMYVALTRAKGRLYLPFAGADSPGAPQARGAPGDARPVRGAYGVVNRRLAELLRGQEPLLSVEDVTPSEAPAGARDAQAAEVPPAPPALPIGAEPAPDYARLRRKNAGAFVTSYTRMKADGSSRRTSSLEESANRDDGAAIDPGDGRPDQLHGARASGVFLHEVLERVPMESFVVTGDREAWRKRADVSALFEEAVTVHRVAPGQRAHAEELVWAAFTTPIDLPGGARMGGIASARLVTREMNFVFAVVAGAGEARDRATRATSPAFVRGAIDLAFEHEGRTYFVDWKSDSLPSYTAGALERCVRERYRSQGEIYALAIAKLLGTRDRDEHDARFGGMFYCFLRGLDEHGHGVWSSRPSWDDLQAWEASLGPMTRGSAAGRA